MIQVLDGKIALKKLPKVGMLKDGRTVSGYRFLDKEILKNEGWLPLEDNPPEHNEETEYLEVNGYEILENKVVKKYKIIERKKLDYEKQNIFAETKELKKEIEVLKKQVQSSNEVAEFQEDLIVELAMMLY